MVRTALLILSGNAAASLVLLMRNLFIARLIPVADYGIAATFMVIVSLMELASNLGLQQQIVQSKRGDDPKFQAALQLFQLLRGIAAGLVLLVLAGPIAEFMGLGEVTWAYRLIALIPVLNALQHFDIHRLNREMSFGPIIATQFFPAVLSLLLVWPLAEWLDDYRVMLFALLAQAVLMAATSHVVASRAWRLSWDRGIMVEALKFGWPLLVNNAMLFAVFQGDRVIVARELGPEVLGIFSMGVTLTLTPTLVLAKSIQNFCLPQLSRLRPSGDAGAERAPYRDRPELARLSYVTVALPLVAGGLFALAVALAGGPVVLLLLGEKYAPLTAYLTWLAVMQAVRVAKAGPTIVALSAGHSSHAMIANGFRLLALPAAFWVAATSGDLLLVIQIAALGELAGYVVAMALFARVTGLAPLRRLAPAYGLLAAFYAGLVSFAAGPAPASAAVAWGLLPALLLAAGLCMTDLRHHLMRRGLPGAPAAPKAAETAPGIGATETRT